MFALRLFSVLCFCIALVHAPSAAADDTRMQALYVAGNFIGAAEEGVTRNTPDSLAFASFSLLRHVMSLEPGSATETHMGLVKRAIAYAEQALAQHPDHIDARVNLAIAIGLEAMEMGSWEAYQGGVGNAVRAHLDQALDADPDHLWALLTLGGWHLEVVRKGGRLPARLIFNASREKGLVLMDRALALASDNIIVLQQVAALFVASKESDLQKRADALLVTALAQTPQDYFENTVLEKCRALQAGLATGDRKEAAQVAIAQIEIF